VLLTTFPTVPRLLNFQWPWTPKKGIFGEFLVFSHCDTYMNMNSAESIWDRPFSVLIVDLSSATFNPLGSTGPPYGGVKQKHPLKSVFLEVYRISGYGSGWPDIWPFFYYLRWVLWGSKHSAVSRLSLLSLLLQSACVNSPSQQKILVGANNKCCQRTTIQCRWTDLFWSSK